MAVVLDPRLCPCGETFTPAPNGFNARYCSKRCKAREKYSRVISDERLHEQKKVAAQRHYQNKKASPERLEKHREQTREGRRAVREWLAGYKKERGCIDCGFNAHASALQLDHLGKKSVSIADSRSSISRLLAEIEAGECVVRCANCHSIKTWAERNGYTYEQYLATFVQT